jgi:hypothetical protein
MLGGAPDERAGHAALAQLIGPPLPPQKISASYRRMKSWSGTICRRLRGMGAGGAALLWPPYDNDSSVSAAKARDSFAGAGGWVE